MPWQCVLGFKSTNLKISVITVTYNSAATVRHALSCVADQDYPNIEHIIVDGASTDNTLNLVGQFPHVHKVISEKDEGIYDAMNKGIRAAEGDIIGILNSDDVYVDEKVISAVARHFEDPGMDACYADLQYVDRHDDNKVVRTWKSGTFSRSAFYWGWMPPHPTFFVRKTVYDRVGLFDTRLKSAADYEMMLRILLKHNMKASYIPRVIVRMRSGGLSNASFINRFRANQEDRLAWKINGLQPYFFTLYIKPLRKVTQFITR
jgi:glycosyltransferase